MAPYASLRRLYRNLTSKGLRHEWRRFVPSRGMCMSGNGAVRGQRYSALLKYTRPATAGQRYSKRKVL